MIRHLLKNFFLTLSVIALIFGTALVQAQSSESKPLQGKRVAILATDGFEKSELFDPQKALEDAGAETVLISTKTGEIKSWDKDNWGQTAIVDMLVTDAKAGDFHALLLPGGVINPDKLRTDPAAIQFIQSFVEPQKPIAAICHGPWTLIDAQGVKGKKVTSWPSLKNDLKNAGATWVDQEVVVDGNLITSRKPEDIPAFNAEFRRILRGS